MRARTTPDGDAISLLEQDRSRWDWLLVGRGLAALDRAYATGGSFGPYALQAAIAACHGRARRPEDTDWRRIVALYDGLVEVTGSPVVELNRAVAVGMADGPEAALALLDDDALREKLDGYYLLPAARGDALLRLGWTTAAREAFEEAAALTENEREREFLRARVG